LSTENAAASGTGTLNVMLVEADTVDTGFDEDGNEIPIYKGQSGGAYEKYWKESPGAVVAIINPHFLPATEVSLVSLSSSFLSSRTDRFVRNDSGSFSYSQAHIGRFNGGSGSCEGSHVL